MVNNLYKVQFIFFLQYKRVTPLCTKFVPDDFCRLEFNGGVAQLVRAQDS